MKNHPLWSMIAGAILVSALLAGCGSAQSSTAEKKELKIGATAGPYSDQLRKGIKPLLEKKGYEVSIVEFNDYVQPNTALASGSIDANVFQNTTYLENYLKEQKADFTSVIPIPTVPMGLYSQKFHSLDEIKEGARISLPNDPTNHARALGMLQTLGLINFGPMLTSCTLPKKISSKTRKRSSLFLWRPPSCLVPWRMWITPSSTETLRWRPGGN